MSVATDKLRTVFNELATAEEVDAEVKSKVALALDSLVDVETEVYNAEDSKQIAINELDEIKAENQRLREYNSQLTMKLGTAVAQSNQSDDSEDDDNTDDETDIDDVLDDYKM